MPYFESYYSSPLTHSTVTANLTFVDIDVPADKPFVPIVKEGFREGMTVHTCNWRLNKTYIADMFPFFEFDELWRHNESETGGAQDARAKGVLDDVWLSITRHSGAISRLIGALNHRASRLSTSQIIPVLVKAKLADFIPDPDFDAHEPRRPVTRRR